MSHTKSFLGSISLGLFGDHLLGYTLFPLPFRPASTTLLMPANNTNTTAGPFDVIWVHPEKSYISNEYWAWSVVKIIIHKKLNSKIFMAEPATRDAHIKRGFEIYVSH